MAFDIRAYVQFDAHGRGDCPCCLEQGLSQGTKTLALLQGRAYHCYRDADHKGSLMEQILIRPVLDESQSLDLEP